MIEFYVLFFAMGLPVFFLGFVLGIWFVLSGGLYVTKYGTVDIRWPPKRQKKRL
ncbi:MAG TPA: hypothetical protein VFA98_06475 [Thermoanaerobaculia bacterium]|nr:hypothetical protein [Thermoanaerobaculia bacterium]